MSNSPIDWTLLLVVGFFGLVLWGAARMNASAAVWRLLPFRDKILSVFLLVVSFVILGLMVIYAHISKAVINSLLGFFRFTP
jgi:hypothetical protein